MPTSGSHTSLWGGSCWLHDGGLLVRIYHSMICIMHDSLPSWHRLVEEWMGCSSHTTMLILSPILTSTGRWTLAWSTIASKSIHYINSKRGSAIPCCNNWRAILFAHWYKLVQQFFSKKTFGGIFYHFERSELYQTSFLDDHIFPRGSLKLHSIFSTKSPIDAKLVRFWRFVNAFFPANFVNFHNVWLCVSIINHVSFQQEAERLPWTAAGALAASPVGVPTLWDCIDDWIFNFLILSSNIVRLHWILTKGHFLTLVTFWKPGKKWVLEIREFQQT